MGILEFIRYRPYARVNDRQAEQFAASLWRHLEAGDYEPVTTALIAASSADRERLLYGLVQNRKAPEVLRRWSERLPDSAHAHLLLGISRIIEGWRVRGTDYAEHVAGRKMKKFHEALNRAESHLHRALELNPAMAEAHARLIQIGMCRNESLDTLSGLFHEGVAQDGTNFACHMMLFTATTEKWCGSHEAMFNFARWASDAAPEGDYLHMFVAEAFNEYGARVAESVNYRKKKLHEHTRSPEHAQAVRTALLRWLDATPETMASQLERKRGGFRQYALGQFALASYLTGALDEARLLLRAVKGEIESTPWGWFIQVNMDWRFPAMVFDRICRELGVQPVTPAR